MKIRIRTIEGVRRFRRLGQQFTRNEAELEVTAEQLEQLEACGMFEIRKGAGAPAPLPGVAEPSDLPSKTVAELRDLARDAGISGFGRMSKAELLEELEG